MTIRLLFRLLSVANYAITLYFYLLLPVRNARKSYGGDWKFLTYLNLWFQLGYFVVAAGCDATGSFKPIRDFLFASVSFPIGIFVSFIFWVLFAIDRELVFPKVLDEIFPPVVNHMMHTAPFAFQLVEIWIDHHAYPSRMVGATTFGALCAAYLGWVCAIAKFGGFWVYPILRVLSVWQRAAFFAVSILVAAGFYLLGELLNRIIWRKFAEDSFQCPSKKYKPKKMWKKAD